MSNHSLSAQNLLATLPQVLQNDPDMAALASSIADILAKRKEEIRRVAIYSRIDDLPEDLLDILAYDFKVDWYNPDYPIEAKRALLKSNWSVHRRLGTKGAISTALSDLYPGSTVEEWFEYGGEPYFFRVVVDVTEQYMDISHDEIIRTIDIYKSLRSQIEEDAIYYRSRQVFRIRTSCGAVVYGVRLCGTYPVRATQGSIEPGNLSVETDGAGTAYRVKMCGTALGSIV